MGGYKATDTWFVGNGIGGSLPLLNHSEHPDYGAQYAGNFFAPVVTFVNDGEYAFADAAVYHPENELDPMRRMKSFLDQQFDADGSGGFGGGLNNTDEEKEQIKAFMQLMYDKVENNAIQIPPVTDNRDTSTVGFACEVLSAFQPAFTMVNLGAVDACPLQFLKLLGRVAPGGPRGGPPVEPHSVHPGNGGQHHAHLDTGMRPQPSTQQHPGPKRLAFLRPQR